jgi:hypothetical protein
MKRSRRGTLPFILGIIFLFFYCQELSWPGNKDIVDRILGMRELIVFGEKSYRHGR